MSSDAGDIATGAKTLALPPDMAHYLAHVGRSGAAITFAMAVASGGLATCSSTAGHAHGHPGLSPGRDDSTAWNLATALQFVQACFDG
jgi:hypothetical protein